MKTNIFANAAALSDDDLLARTRILAATEREATAELLGHLAALELRPAVYAALGYGSLYGYCTQALGLTEDAACTRIAVTRWCRQFPLVVDLMACGSLSLTAVRLLGPHLTAENHEAVLSPCREQVPHGHRRPGRGAQPAARPAGDGAQAADPESGGGTADHAADDCGAVPSDRCERRALGSCRRYRVHGHDSDR